ncbi:MAG: S8 family peptidase [Actinomycetota bacterium]|nr:S8 family peptidase [Actinomycetota bacterium]
MTCTESGNLPTGHELEPKRRNLRVERIVGALVLATALLAPAAAAWPEPAPTESKLDPVLLHVVEHRPDGNASVIVRATSRGELHALSQLVTDLGGEVGFRLPLITGLAGTLPAARLEEFATHPAVRRVWADGRLEPADHDDDDDDDDEWDEQYERLVAYDTAPANDQWRAAIGLDEVRRSGNGVTVAVLDTGVARNPELGSRVRARVDFTPELDGWDRYGHGSHMIGIVAGDGSQSSGRHAGVAPGADIVSIKAGNWNGATDVSVVLAGLQWAVSHRAEHDIRVLNLSFGTDSTQTYLHDPLNFAVERVWKSGIVVVSSAGNAGPGPSTITKPGDDPFVITVGAADLAGTASTEDVVVADFSSRGPTSDGLEKPDLVAPGISIVSHRVVDSTVDELRPAARVGDHYFKGTGTSQAAAIVSGAAALLLEADPTLAPDEVKSILTSTAEPLETPEGSGAGLLDVEEALDEAAENHPPANVGLLASDGLGSLDDSRGSLRVVADIDDDNVSEPVVGEIDVLGNPWDAKSWSAKSWSAASWDSEQWASLVNESPGWQAKSWSGATWSGMGWDAKSWSAKSWSELDVDPDGWSAKSWSAGLWN